MRFTYLNEQLANGFWHLAPVVDKIMINPLF